MPMVAHLSEPSLDFDALWASFRNKHIAPEGRVIDNGNNGISHSEGQGYAMVLAERANDRETFDKLLAWSEVNLARDDMALFSWRYDPSLAIPVSDRNNASDGDILIAWALTLAAARWGDETYAARAQEIRAAISDHLLIDQGGRTFLLPGRSGFDKREATTLNLSYYIWPALRAFAVAEPDGPWVKVVGDGEWLLEKAAFGPLRLPTDWVDLMPDGQVQPAEGWQPQFGFDAVRVALYLHMDGRYTQDAHIASFWTSRIENDLTIPAWINVRTGETAPFGLSPGGLAVASMVTGTPLSDGVGSNGQYYSDVLSLLVAAF